MFPNEILVGISELLDISHPPSLFAFALTSKRHYAISSRFLFRTIRITLGDYEEPEQLLAHVQKWERMLIRSEAFAYVRRLILYSASLDPGLPDNPYLALEPCERDDDATRLQSFWDLYHSFWCPGVDESPIRDENWQMLARLVRQLRGLTDIFYACIAQFPPGLLETLHAELPQCRLHHYTFHLNDPNGAYERSLAISSCLYSIGDLDHVGDDIGWALARRHAPRLRSVFIWHRGRTIRDIGVVNYDGGKGTPSLEQFQLGTFEGPYPSLSFALLSRMAFGNLSALHVLKLDTVLHHHTLPAPDNFPSLVTLTLTCITSPVPAHYWDEVLVFLRNLHRLTTLQLKDWKRSVSVVPGLNPNLRKLDLSTDLVRGADPLRSDHVQQLAELCPHLEDLAVEIRRSRGDATEVALYRALGRLPRLRRLTLVLDASPPPFVHVTEADGTVTRDTAIEPWFDA